MFFNSAIIYITLIPPFFEISTTKIIQCSLVVEEVMVHVVSKIYMNRKILEDAFLRLSMAKVSLPTMSCMISSLGQGESYDL